MLGEIRGTVCARFEIYGLRLEVGGDWRDVVRAIEEDFAWFSHFDRSAADMHSAPATADLTVSIHRRRPDHGRFGAIPQTFVTSRNVVYQLGELTLVDYGRVLAVYDRARETFTVEGEDEDLVHEATYLFLLSRIGRHLDGNGLTRIHAVGLSGAHGAVLVLLPSGGGKTTLALRALHERGVKLLSEDTPLLDRDGRLHPFPLRIGVNESDAGLLPSDDVRRIERLEYGPKLLLSVDAFADVVESQPQPLKHVVIGRRWLSGGGQLTPLPRRALVAPLVRDGVVGLGVAQMIEYVLRQGPVDFLRQGGVAASRARCCAHALRRARTWRLDLARDPDRNWEALQPLLV